VVDLAFITLLLLKNSDEAVLCVQDPRLGPMTDQTDLIIIGLQLLDGACQ